MKTHLHSEQFDGHLHAECCAGSDYNGLKIVGERTFGALPAKERCRRCTKLNWPYGGDPK